PIAVAIPKTIHADRLEENLEASEILLDARILEELDRAFPPPLKKTPLHII
ncbi:MAG: aldo/keto reductase, partial [Burkholderiaceae bacterium]|nr:aldo/keto reductase [Burkholderiaceae bacterium]